MSHSTYTNLLIPLVGPLSDKRLSYRRGTARHAMITNSCHVSRGTGVFYFKQMTKGDLRD